MSAVFSSVPAQPVPMNGGGGGKQQLYTISYVPVSDDSQLPDSPGQPALPQRVQMMDRRFEQSMPVGPIGQTMSPAAATHTIEMPELEPLSSPHEKQHRNRKPKKKTKSIFRSGVDWWRDDLSHDERKCIVYAGCCCVICGGVPMCPSPCACASPCGNDCCGCKACTDCLPFDCLADLTRCAKGDCFSQCDTCNSCGSCSIM